MQIRKVTIKKLGLLMAWGLSLSMIFGNSVSAVSTTMTETENSLTIAATGVYSNWDGVTNVAQFTGADGKLYYAVDSNDYVTVYKTNDGKATAETVTLQKQHPIFGTAICDSEGCFYLVTGENNTTNDTTVETIFISKYDNEGNHIKTTGDNGSSSLAYYYDESFYTKQPFEAGNCDAAISGKILTVNYARKMYSGHQSNSVFSVNIDDMSKVNVGVFYESHSFAQRVVPTSEGFVYVSEGDCYDRAFTVYSVKMSGNTCSYSKEEATFDFWVKDGAFDEYNMYVVNENFAHMGGVAALSNGKVAFVAQSVQSLNSDASSESEEIFLQIFDPYKSLDSANAYVTTGVRSGLAGNNGRTSVTNYGVKWLTSYGTGSKISNVQIAATDKDEIVVLYEYSEGYNYKGVYYIIVDAAGNVTCPATLYDATARLNPCEMPVFSEGKVCWVGNKYGDSSKKIYIYTLGLEEDNTLDISFGKSLSLENNLSINYLIAASQTKGCENVTLHVIKNCYNGGILTTTKKDIPAVTVYYGSTPVYKFTYNGIAAKEMGDEFTAYLTGTKDGVTYTSQEDIYSIKTYATNMLGSSGDAKLKTLLVDMLNYGAEAQKYFNYRVDELVNKDLDEKQLALGTATLKELKDTSKPGTNNAATANFAGKGLRLGNSIEVMYYLKFAVGQDMTNIKLKLSYKDVNGNTYSDEIPASRFEDFSGSDQIKIAYYSGVVAKDARCVITAGIYDGDTLISETCDYSIECYAKSKSTDETLGAIVTSIMKYCDSATAYFTND